MDDEEEEYEEFKDWARRHDLFKPLTTKYKRIISEEYQFRKKPAVPCLENRKRTIGKYK
jgi:hypothetical protein